MIDEFWYSTNKLELMHGYKQLFHEHGATHLVTFVFNIKGLSITEAEKFLNKWHRKLDKKLFGHFYYKRQRHERTSFIAIPENKLTNLHYHAFLRTSQPREFEVHAQAIWKELVKGGNLHLGNPSIDELQIAKWSNYVDCELMCENNMDLMFISKANPKRKEAL